MPYNYTKFACLSHSGDITYWTDILVGSVPIEHLLSDQYLLFVKLIK